MHTTKEFVIRKQPRKPTNIPLKPGVLDKSGESSACLKSSSKRKNKFSIARSVRSLHKGGSNDGSENKERDIEIPKPTPFSPSSSGVQIAESPIRLRQLGSIEDMLIQAGPKSPRFGDSPLAKHKFYTPTARTNPNSARLKPVNGSSFDTVSKMATSRPMPEKYSPVSKGAHFKARSEFSLPLLAGSLKPLKKPIRTIGVTSYHETLQGCGENGVIDKPNQDYSASKDLKTDRGVAYIRLVADGHGSNGHLVSQLVGDKVMELVSDAISTFDDSVTFEEYAKEMLPTAFDIADSTVMSSGIDIKFSGSTLTVAIIWQNVLAIANTGDSKAVLLSKVKNLISVSAETCLQHPEEENERKRILESGGIIAQYTNKEGELDGPQRVWKQDYSGPGLAVARSFGDTQGKEIGVISKPDVFVKKLNADDKAVVLASDGLWEYLSHKTLVNKMVPFILSNNVRQACKSLVRLAADKWQEVKTLVTQLVSGRDDITVQVLFFH